MHALAHRLRFLVLLPLLLSSLAAQGGKFAVSAAFEPAAAKPGDTVQLVLTATVADGWHAYGTKEPTNIPVALKPSRLQLAGLELDGAAQVPPGDKHTTVIGDSYPLPRTFEVRQALRVPAGMAAGEVELKGALDYQICDENSCLPPAKVAFTAKLSIAAGGDAGLTTKPGLRLEPDQKFAVAASMKPASARAGETVTLVLDAVVDPRFHAYGTLETTNIPVSLDAKELKLAGLEAVGQANVPPGEAAKAWGMDTFPLPHEFQVTQQLRVPTGTAPGVITIEGKLHYQICDENHCEPPADIAFSATLQVEAGAAAVVEPPKAEPASVEPAAAKVSSDNPFANSWWALILACIGGGLFALAMPCTYPMIPITFSFFTKQAEKRHGKVLPLALTYGFGIVAMFVLVGVALATVIGPIVNHWITNVIIGAAFFLFAFALFGWINLQPPQFLQRAAGKASTTGGLVGVFFMGATLVITSFTCTAPIVGTLLPKVAELGHLRVGVGMGVFGLTMAAPFVVLSLMPGKVKTLPRSGEWMETLKISLGFIELAAAFKFVSMVDFYFGWQALPRELFLLLWTAIFGLWALFLFGILRKAGTPNEGVGNGRMAAGMTVTLIATYCLFGALGYKLDFYITNFLPGYSAQSVIARGGGNGESGAEHVLGKHRIVLDDAPKAIALAKADDKLLLYNFTGFN